MEKLIGREKEQAELRRCYESERSEFVVVYGRRRIGKTFLVNKVYGESLAFHFTGYHNAPMERQLELFAKALQQCGQLTVQPRLDSWYHAFDALEQVLSARRQKGKKVLFFDEMPWVDTYNSGFVSALEGFWNAWAAQRDDVMLIACGSATSWMADKLIENQGGLYNRVTSKIYLPPFSLAETEQYLRSHRCQWDRYAIVQYYMYLGGIPYYMSLLDYGKSLEANIDELFFQPGGRLAGEFGDLYSVLFRDADKYVQIVKALAIHREGMNRQQIAATATNGGGLTKMLENLERCDFITSYQHFGNKKKGIIYRLTDFYTMFYLKFVEGVRQRTSPYWYRRVLEPDVLSWQGGAFETVGLLHIEPIMRRLGINGMLNNVSAWRGSSGVQIDLVIDRSDRIIHLCEMKFSREAYEISRDHEERLREKTAAFRSETKTRKALLTTFITTYGVKRNLHAGIVHDEVTMDDLFSI